MVYNPYASPIARMIEAARTVARLADRLASDCPPDGASYAWPGALEELTEAAAEYARQKQERELERQQGEIT